MAEIYTSYYTKEYFEEYARTALNDLVKLDLIHRSSRYGIDRPDLISKDEYIGVEVTNALDDNAGRHRKLFQKQYPKENRAEAIRAEAKRLGIVKDLCIVKGIATLKMDGGSRYYISTLTKAINTKLLKLNNDGFNKYHINALYINAYLHYPEDIEDVLNNFNKYIIPQPIMFDTIYILNNCGLYVYKNGTYSIINISTKQFDLYKTTAYKFAKTHHKN